MSLIMIMNFNLNLNISIGRRIAVSACWRSLISPHTVNVNVQMEQIFQSIHASVVIVRSQCRCRSLTPGADYCPGKAANRRKETRPGWGYRISCKQLLRWQKNNEIIYVYGVTGCWPTSKRQRAYCAYCILYMVYKEIINNK